MWKWIAKKIMDYIPAINYKGNIRDALNDLSITVRGNKDRQSGVNKIYEDKIKKLESLEIVECEICGCLLNKKTAYRGKPEMVEVPKNIIDQPGESFSSLMRSVKGNNLTGDTKEYSLKETYYCKIHIKSLDKKR